MRISDWSSDVCSSDLNWGYADYQLEKIQKAIENGLERRPKRAQSAQHFLTVTVPQMKEALKKKDTVVFNKNFQVITNRTEERRVEKEGVSTCTTRCKPYH